MDTYSIVMHIVGMVLFVTIFAVWCYLTLKRLKKTDEWLKDMKNSKEENPLRKV